MSIIVNSHFLFKELRDDLRNIYEGAEPDILSFWLIEDLLKITKSQILIGEEVPIDANVLNGYEVAKKQLIAAYPIQYILGYAYFFGEKFKVSSGVLIPRPETEDLVNKALEKGTQAMELLDIGTGSGCIAITLKRRLPSANVHGWDEDIRALKVAKSNAKTMGEKVMFHHQDVFERWPEKKWDLIVSNPPYVLEKEKEEIHRNVLEHEPAGALFVPDDIPLLFYTRITDQSVKYLNRGGWLLFEINENYGPQMEEMMKTRGFSQVELIADSFGKDRIVIGQKG